MRDRVVVVGLVDEEHARLAGAPGAVDDLVPDLARVELADDLAGLGIDAGRSSSSASTASMNASVTATEMLKLVTCVVSSLQVMNSMMSGWSTRRMPMLAPRRVPPCFTTSVRGVEQPHERDRARGHARGGAHDVVLGPEPREAEAGAAAGLVDQRHGAEGVVDAVLAVGERVVDRQDEAGARAGPAAGRRSSASASWARTAAAPSGRRTPRPPPPPRPSVAPYRRSASAIVRATRQNRSSGVSTGLPVSSLTRYRFSRTVMALGDSESASRGVDEFMELPACDMEEKRVQRLHYGNDRAQRPTLRHPCFPRPARPSGTAPATKRMAKLGQATSGTIARKKRVATRDGGSHITNITPCGCVD